MPALPGLVPPRISNRAPLDATLRASSPAAEPQGLMRPHLPSRKPMPSPPPVDTASSEVVSSAVDDEPSSESQVFTGSPIYPSAMPRRLAPPPKPPMLAGPTAASNSTGTGMAPRRRATPAPHNAATITAMRIISIGVEDKPPLSEIATKVSEPAEAILQAPATLARAFEGRDESVPLPQLAPLPAFEISEALELPPQTALAPLPAFEMPEPEQEKTAAETAPLPAFEMPEPEQQPQEPAIAPLPEFEILRPIEAPPDSGASATFRDACSRIAT